MSKHNRFTLEDASSYLEIDLTSIDMECSTHPVLVDRVGVACATATDRRDTLKSELKQLEAKIAIEIKRGKNREDSKITDAMLNRMVTNNERYKDKNDDYLKANLEVGLWEAKKEAYKARTYMISSASNMVRDGMRSDIVVKSKNSQEVAYEQSKKRYGVMSKDDTVGRRRRLNNEEE